MITYSRDSHEAIPPSAVKIIGLGGAGANMLERIALDSIEGAELLALNTDIRTLGASMAKEKIQLGVNLTKGLGTGGDPELGQQAMLEAEGNVRKALRGQRIVFLCTGLGGGTGSGAAPIVSRIAREEGAFVVVFATMPFFFEGLRRREQAETSLNQLAVLSNALVTFDNNRMGELVLAKQGIHEAFAAADRMISESIKAVIRLVIRPGLINVGLDDLMSALRTNRSRCLFGSGMADGKDRASKALRNALSSPLLDQGSLLKEAQTVLVHLSGGESLTLFEIELLMQNLQKYVPEKAHVLFGAAIDPAMGDNLSITLISALPEDYLTGGPRESQRIETKPAPTTEVVGKKPREIPNPFLEIDQSNSKQAGAIAAAPQQETASLFTVVASADGESPKDLPVALISDPESDQGPRGGPPVVEIHEGESGERNELADDEQPAGESTGEDRPFAEHRVFSGKDSAPETEREEQRDEEESLEDEAGSVKSATWQGPKTRPDDKPIWGNPDSTKNKGRGGDDPFEETLGDDAGATQQLPNVELKLDPARKGAQSELSFEKSPRGRFQGEAPNVFEGEDLDLPPFLRKKKP